MARTRSGAIRRAPVEETAPIIENSGVCSTCDDALTCIYAGNAEQPVLECEEFTHHRTAVPKPAMRRLNLAAAPRPETEDVRQRLAMGLCADCENRSTCTFLKADGGVWQCEEYR